MVFLLPSLTPPPPRFGKRLKKIRFFFRTPSLTLNPPMFYLIAAITKTWKMQLLTIIQCTTVQRTTEKQCWEIGWCSKDRFHLLSFPALLCHPDLWGIPRHLSSGACPMPKTKVMHCAMCRDLPFPALLCQPDLWGIPTMSLHPRHLSSGAFRRRWRRKSCIVHRSSIFCTAFVPDLWGIPTMSFNPPHLTSSGTCPKCQRQKLSTNL